MICENGSTIYPDTCVINNTKGYAEFPKDATTVASVDFSFPNNMSYTKCYIAIAGEMLSSGGNATFEIVDKALSKSCGGATIKPEQLADNKEVRIPFFVDNGAKEFTLNTTYASTGKIYATVKYEVG